MASLFQLPEELLLSSLFERFPCRERQIRSLATLLHVSRTSFTWVYPRLCASSLTSCSSQQLLLVQTLSYTAPKPPASLLSSNPSCKAFPNLPMTSRKASPLSSSQL